MDVNPLESILTPYFVKLLLHSLIILQFRIINFIYRKGSMELLIDKVSHPFLLKIFLFSCCKSRIKFTEQEDGDQHGGLRLGAVLICQGSAGLSAARISMGLVATVQWADPIGGSQEGLFATDHSVSFVAEPYLRRSCRF